MSYSLKSAIRYRKQGSRFTVANFRAYKIGAKALANQRYSWGIRHLEMLRRRHRLSDRAEYLLAQLYDHNAKKQKERMLCAAAKAEQLYRNIAKRNPKYFLAIYGLGRVYWIRGDYHSALRLQRRAYRKMMTRPRRMRGALGIGQLYEETADYRNAEKWYQKEFRSTDGDLGTTINLMRFYMRRGFHRKARKFAIRADRILGIEFSRSVYRDLAIQDSNYVRRMKLEIARVKSFRAETALKSH